MKQITIFRNFSQVIGHRTLPEILKAIQQGVYQKEVLAVRRAVQRGNQKIANETKKQLQAFTVSGRFEGGRTMAKLKEYHSLVILDIDKLATDVLKKSLKVIRKITYTHACFLSPSGNGCKVIVRINSNQSQHRSAYLQVAAFYEKKLRLKIDPSGKDITRLCFFSFDKNLFSNSNSQVFKVKSPTLKSLPFEAKMKIEQTTKVSPFEKKETTTSKDKLQACLNFTKHKSSYVPGNRNNFVYLFASNCNREGISAPLVLDFALHHFDLAENEIRKTIHSVFHHHQNEHNSNLQKLKSPQLVPDKNQTSSFVEKMLETPCFPDSIFQQLPKLLKRGCEVLETARERDIFLTGALIILSGSMLEVEGLYDRNRQFPNLFGFIVAPAASGKGALRYAKILGDALHEKYIAAYEAQKREYNEAMEKYQMSISDFRKRKIPTYPEEPKPLNRKPLFIPGNSSAAMVIRQLKNSNGSGIICETEADTLSNALKQDWGGFSDMLRKAFHFETVSYARKSADELFEIKEPRLSVALSGTPDQVYGLIPSPEDGLFSRFLFYAFSTDTDWRDVSEDERTFDLLAYYRELSEEVINMIEWLEAHPTKVKLSKEQWNFLNDFFQKLLHQVSTFNDLEAASMVKRLGVILFRILMILTAIRKFEEKKSIETHYCSQVDFIIGIKIIEVFWAHGLFMFEHLPKQKRQPFQKAKNHKQDFFDSLPEQFNRQDAIQMGVQYNLSRATVDRLLKKYKNGFVQQTGHGIYSKMPKNE